MSKQVVIDMFLNFTCLVREKDSKLNIKQQQNMKNYAHLIYAGHEIKITDMFVSSTIKRKSNTIATKNKSSFALKASQIISIISKILNILIQKKWLMRLKM